MPSHSRNPFPGVNPFVEAEQYWDDFHSRFLTYLSSTLLGLLPPAYDVRIEERIVTSDRTEEAMVTRRQHRQSDVAIIERPGEYGDAASAGGVAVAEVANAVALEIVEFDEERAKSLSIRRIDDDELITSIELLSPTNKNGKGYEEFTKKRREWYAANVNTVDLDLLRDGRRLAFNTPLPVGDFFAFVAAPARSRMASAYAWALRDRLPAIRVPLAEGDPDIVVDLAKPYDDAFMLGGYPRRLRYRKSLFAWDAATNAWARGLIAASAT